MRIRLFLGDPERAELWISKERIDSLGCIEYWLKVADAAYDLGAKFSVSIAADVCDNIDILVQGHVKLQEDAKFTIHCHHMVLFS